MWPQEPHRLSATFSNLLCKQGKGEEALLS
jgi:hypothetical protein